MRYFNPRVVASSIRPRSILITKDVYHTIYPHATLLRTVPVIFSRVGCRAMVEKEIAEYLEKNYEGITIDPYIEPVVDVPQEPEPEQEYRPPVPIPEIECELEDDIPVPEPAEEEVTPLTSHEDIEIEIAEKSIPAKGGKKK